jgi:PAS domain S-box-containing protein
MDSDVKSQQELLKEISDLNSRLSLAEARLVQQEHLLDNVNDIIIAFDEKFNVTYWNRAAEKVYGWKAEEAVGRNVTEIFYQGLVEDEVVIVRRKTLADT